MRNDPVVEVTNITLNKTELEMTVGETFGLTTEVEPENATDSTVTWESSNENVAKVDDTGKITAIAKGTAVITAKAGTKTAKCSITVKEALDISLNVDKFIPGNGIFVGKLNVQNPEEYTVKIISKTLKGVIGTSQPDENGVVNIVFVGESDLLNQYGYEVFNNEEKLVLNGDIEPIN